MLKKKKKRNETELRRLRSLPRLKSFFLSRNCSYCAVRKLFVVQKVLVLQLCLPLSQQVFFVCSLYPHCCRPLGLLFHLGFFPCEVSKFDGAKKIKRPLSKSLYVTPDRPIDRPTDRPTDRLTDRPTDQPIDRPTDQPIDRPANRPINRLTDRPTDRPTATGATVGDRRCFVHHHNQRTQVGDSYKYPAVLVSVPSDNSYAFFVAFLGVGRNASSSRY